MMPINAAGIRTLPVTPNDEPDPRARRCETIEIFGFKIETIAAVDTDDLARRAGVDCPWCQPRPVGARRMNTCVLCDGTGLIARAQSERKHCECPECRDGHA
jgi:hypothetical protein